MVMQDDRPRPDELLEIAQNLESSSKGKLKIYLGMAAGVGKTYAMLEDAQKLTEEGTELVVGIIDTHGRKETAYLLEGLKVIPPKVIDYRNQRFDEPDIDALIKLKPQIVLIDELAHSNVPGSKHEKRWQDVFELLDHGIDVNTTLNVQHIESLNDMVSGIAGVIVRETVPDSVVERATSIQLVDITPDELLSRLKEGKVYIGKQTQIAADNFFKKDKLTALREIALRYAADKIDYDLNRMEPTEPRVFVWKPREKYLVAICAHPHAIKLIRNARRLAASASAPWIALHIDDGEELSEEENTQLLHNLRLAKDLGAEVVTLLDPKIEDGIEKFSKQEGVTQILIGRPPKSFFFGRTMLDKLIDKCKDIDIHVLKQEQGATLQLKNKGLVILKRQKISQYFLMLVLIAILSIINYFLLPFVGYKVVGAIFLLAILTFSLFFRKGPIFLATALYAFIWLLFIPPFGTLNIDSWEDITLLMLYVSAAVTVGILVDRERKHKEMLTESERSTRLLYDIVRQLNSAFSPIQALIFIQDNLGKFLDGKINIIIKSQGEMLYPDNEKEIAAWSFEKGQEAGWSSDNFSTAKSLYIPIKTSKESIGLFVFTPKSNHPLSQNDRLLISSVIRELAAFFEKK